MRLVGDLGSGVSGVSSSSGELSGVRVSTMASGLVAMGGAAG